LDNEEILSGSDVEMNGDADDHELRESQARRKRKIHEYPELLAKRHKGFEKYRYVTHDCGECYSGFTYSSSFSSPS